MVMEANEHGERQSLSEWLSSSKGVHRIKPPTLLFCVR